MRDKQGAAAIGLYSFFAEHIDPTLAVLWSAIAGKVCAYALDPHEVWKGYNTSKDYSAFVTKTLVNKDGEIKRRIMAMFSGEESGQEQ